jgi:hypothetical protein
LILRRSPNGHPATLTYRDGHQVSFAPNALGQATQAITHFFYSQAGQLLYTSEGASTLRYNHIHLAGSLVAKRLVPFSGTTSIRYQHTDALGSPVAETSETGVLTRRERMTAYGEPADGTWQSGPGSRGIRWMRRPGSSTCGSAITIR